MSHTNRFICILFLFTHFCFGQNNAVSNAGDFVSQNAFLHKQHLEKFFLHTNKSLYFSGESIWFQAYIVYDITETPSFKTSNIYINIYNAEKKLITNQLVFASNGKVEGNILLPDDLKTGTYYIQLETNWNKNFDNYYIKPFQVNNLKDGFADHSNSENIEIGAIKMKFFPESNLLLEEIENNIYFTITDNNNPIKSEGIIIDSSNQLITEFTSDMNGIGVFALRTNEDREYYAVIKRNNEDLKFAIPSAEKTGIVIHKKEDHTNDAISISLKTNKETIKQQKGNTFFAVIHRKGYVLSVIPIELNGEYESYNLKLLKADLFNGVNTITLFNENNQAIAERNIYSTDKEFIEMDVSKVTRNKDSTSLNLNLKNIFSTSNVSISVLPEESLLYQNQHTIISDFLITPYLTDKSGNITSYLQDASTDIKRLDNFIQTKSKITFNTRPNNKKTKFPAEVGMRISGSAILNKAVPNSKIMLTSQENNIVLMSKLKPDNTFVFDSLLLKQGSNYKLALVDPKGKLLKASLSFKEEFLDYKLNPTTNINLEAFRVKTETIPRKPIGKVKTEETLDEVVIQGKKKKVVLADDYPDPKVRANSFTKTYEIKENRYSPNQTVMDVIKDLPGVEVDNYSSKIRSTRGAKSIIPGSRNDEVAVIMNGVRVSDFDLLRAMNATEIIEAKVNASGAGYGLDGFAGVVILKTKGDIDYSKSKSKNKKTIASTKTGSVDFGFTIPIEDYKNYDVLFPTKNSRIYYSTLDWLPNVELKPNTDNIITVFTGGLEEIKLIINGQNDKGNLIFKMITINNKN